MNGQFNINHAEQKIFSYANDNYAGQPIKIQIAIQNNSKSAPGMCVGCKITSRNFYDKNREFDITIFQGTTGVTP